MKEQVDRVINSQGSNGQRVVLRWCSIASKVRSHPMLHPRLHQFTHPLCIPMIQAEPGAKKGIGAPTIKTHRRAEENYRAKWSQNTVERSLGRSVEGTVEAMHVAVAVRQLHDSPSYDVHETLPPERFCDMHDPRCASACKLYPCGLPRRAKYS